MQVRDAHATLLRLASDWTMPPHRHDGHHELIVVLAGRLETRIAGRTIGGGVGTALVYPRGEVHEEWARGGRPLTTVCLSWRGDLPGGDLQLADVRGHAAAAARWLAELCDERVAQPAATAGLCTALLHELTRPARPREDLLARVRAWAVPRLAQPLGLDDLARAAGLSRFHFVRVFRTAAGVTPMRWLRALRLQAARTLLLTSDQPLRAIAPQVGFADEFQLSRVFRRDFGATPGSLRRREQHRRTPNRD